VDRSATRVVDAQRQAATTLRLTLSFVLAAAAAAASGAGDGPWLALHLLLVGGVLTAIAAATQLLAVTWSAAPAPADRGVAVQRALLAGGALAVAGGRELDLTAVAAIGGTAVAAGLAHLTRNLLAIRRAGRQDRFRPAIDAYVLGLVAALAGVALGGWMVAGSPTASWVDVRAAHVTLNLFGLVGLVIAGTLPTFVATQARTRMAERATPAAQRAVTTAMALGVAGLAAGQVLDRPVLAAAGRIVVLAGWLALLALLPRLGVRQLRWAGPRLLQLGAGVGWWIAVTAALVAGDLDGRVPPTDVLAALAVGGVAQVLVASLAYLGPVIRAGGHERLSAGFATTRSWTSLVAANVAAVALVTGATAPAAVALAVWGVDVAWRAGRLLDLLPHTDRTPIRRPA